MREQADINFRDRRPGYFYPVSKGHELLHSEVFYVTHEWIDKHASSRGGWTRDQLFALGVDWPPPKGWRREVEGTLITPAAMMEFEFDLAPGSVP